MIKNIFKTGLRKTLFKQLHTLNYPILKKVDMKNNNIDSQLKECQDISEQLALLEFSINNVRQDDVEKMYAALQENGSYDIKSEVMKNLHILQPKQFKIFANLFVFRLNQQDILLVNERIEQFLDSKNLSIFSISQILSILEILLVYFVQRPDLDPKKICLDLDLLQKFFYKYSSHLNVFHNLIIFKYLKHFQNEDIEWQSNVFDNIFKNFVFLDQDTFNQLLINLILSTANNPPSEVLKFDLQCLTKIDSNLPLLQSREIVSSPNLLQMIGVFCSVPFESKLYIHQYIKEALRNQLIKYNETDIRAQGQLLLSLSIYFKSYRDQLDAEIIELIENLITESIGEVELSDAIALSLLSRLASYDCYNLNNKLVKDLENSFKENVKNNKIMESLSSVPIAILTLKDLKSTNLNVKKDIEQLEQNLIKVNPMFQQFFNSPQQIICNNIQWIMINQRLNLENGIP